MLTDDPNHPDLTRGIDAAPVPQNKVYLVLSEAERAKGFVRPVRRAYIHSRAHQGGRACGAETKMGLALCETYARDPKFYGATYCVYCSKHLSVSEFDWIEADGSVGPPVGS